MLNFAAWRNMFTAGYKNSVFLSITNFPIHDNSAGVTFYITQFLNFITT